MELICISLLADVCAEPEDRDQDQGEDNSRYKISVTVCHLVSVFIDCRAESKDRRHSDHRKDDTDDGSACASCCSKELTNSGIYCNNIEQRLISDGAGCVSHTGANITYAAENDFHNTLNREYRKGQNIKDCKYRRSKHQIRTELTPAGVRAVRNLAHHRVVDRIPDSCDQDDSGNSGACQADDISIENVQVVVDHVPAHLASDLSKTVACQQLRTCFFVLNCSRFGFSHSFFPPLISASAPERT